MRAHQHVRRDPPCKLSRHRRAALGTARVERGSGGGGGGGAKDGEIGHPLESDDRSYLMSDAIRGHQHAMSGGTHWQSVVIRLAPVRKALQRLRQGVWTLAPRPLPDEGRNQTHSDALRRTQEVISGWTLAPRPHLAITQLEHHIDLGATKIFHSEVHVGRAPGLALVPDEAGHQRSSEVIRGHQRSSEVIRGHQRSSVVISGHQRSSGVISGHQSPARWARGAAAR